MSILQLIDHTLLKADALPADFERLCREAKQYGFASVAINPAQSLFCAGLLRGSTVKVDSAVGFPLGQTTTECKVFETIDAIAKGSQEIDYVINIARLRAGDIAYTREEMRQITEACHSRGVLCKVIFETCCLTNEQKITLCHIANDIGPDFIKTSTGFSTAGATLEDVRLMRQYADPAIAVKAAGGIRDLKTARQFVDAGARRIGTSAGVKIAAQLEEDQ